MDELRFDGRVALITGAGAGLGRAHALLFAARGAAVVVNDLGVEKDGSGANAGPAEAVCEEIRRAGGVAIAQTSSVTSEDGANAMVQAAVDEFGRIDIVVNNAGILRDKSLHGMTSDMFDAVVAVHLAGSYNVTRAAYPHMRDQQYGRIIMTSSPAGLYGNFGQTNYAACKMGVIGMARTIAQEGARKGVHANVISPSASTRMTEGLTGDLGDLLDPALVSPVVAWLCHDSCDVSGEVFAVGGGRVARVFIGENPGFVDRQLTPESVAANLGTIMSGEGIAYPTDVPGASALIAAALAT